MDIGAVGRDGFLDTVGHVETALGGRVVFDEANGLAEVLLEFIPCWLQAGVVTDPLIAGAA